MRKGLKARLMESDLKFVVELRNCEAQINPGNSGVPKNYGRAMTTGCMVSG